MACRLDTIQTICKGIKDAHDLGAEIAIVVGGGNFWRGRSSGEMERTRADQIGMLATAMNALAVADALEHLGVRGAGADSFVHAADRRALYPQPGHPPSGKRESIILACGTGNPFFSTDTASALRAAEINADIIFKATMVDGVYDKVPQKICRCKKIRHAYVQPCAGGPACRDGQHTAATMCRDNSLPILVFDILHPENIAKAVAGEPIGTLVVEQ